MHRRGPLILFSFSLLITLLVVAGASDARTKHTHKHQPKPNPFAAACTPASTDPAIRTIHTIDAWRSSAPYKFPFYGWTPRGPGDVIWKHIVGSTVRKATYPTPNLPGCRVGRFGTEDRSAHKAGKHFEMLEPIDGVMTYEFKDTFDRHIATLSWTSTSPEKNHPSRWGWFIDDKWAGHGATRAFEAQSNACKLVAQPTTTMDANGQPVTRYQWMRDPRYVMVAFSPILGSPGRGYAPSGGRNLRVRAFLDRRAIPPAMLANLDHYDFGCGSTTLHPWLKKKTLNAFYFNSGFGPNRSYVRGYYFGEGPTTITRLPGEKKTYNRYAYSIYNPRPQFHHATYAMVNTTAVGGGGIVRGVVQSTVDRFTLYDEMRYCDPNYTLRGMQVRKGKKHYKKSLYFDPASYSRRNRPSVRWVFGRLDPNPTTLTAEQALATQNPASQRLFAWLPIYCDR